MSVVRLAVLLALTLGAATVADPLRVHRDAVVVDLHVDTLLDLAAGKRTLDGGGGQVDIPRLRQGGVDVQVFAAYIDPGQAPRGKERARELITAFHRAMAGTPARSPPRAPSRRSPLRAAPERSPRYSR